jgi:hypothetical protein
VNEIEYIQATNLAKIRMAKSILLEVLTGNDYGVSPIKYANAMENLSKIEDKLTKEVKTTDSKDSE